MLKPTRTILALAAGSLVLGLVGAGAAVADADPLADNPGQENIVDDQEQADDLADDYPDRKHARGIVISRGPLTVRSKPTTHSHKVGRVHPHQKLTIECKKRGERVDGNNLWYLLDGKREAQEDMNGEGPGAAATMDRKDHWVAARYVKNLGEVRYCRS
ncbi:MULTISPECIES: hypothetical protein [unclassified Streptomyces]|uniref:hypothetical protein n=1 Tax=unclassified Streptomyces TaxID=2593676 RepID=UPI000DC76232|nr:MULTISPECIES: hypothetical protein [unclassified Streptomyces]AWZ09207.1 hypothetical protein DRB89_37220 [Streptomyces sp. ICC4]AWZ15558.1 hypothetical protein DRB96_28550 [Streptomyces sp. ICC1]